MANHFDRPVHQVLKDYDLLDVSVIQNQHTINMSSALLWRMNLCAVSKEMPCTFFVAMNYKIHVYELDTIHSSFNAPQKTLASPNALQAGGGLESPYIINAIKVDKLLDKEILVSVCENGEICIWRTEDLDKPAMILNNNGISTWGIALHTEQGLLAVSANNFKITIYNLLELTKENPIFGTATQSRRYWLKNTEQIELEGHEHNIPNIDFNATGRYLASVSIDSTCRVWDLTTKQVISSYKVPDRRRGFLEQQFTWCWAAKFIQPGNFKYLVCQDKELTTRYTRRLVQGRSTSLVNLDLCHSASIPAFPMNVSSILDLDSEEADFEIYEGDEEGEELESPVDAWDNLTPEQRERQVESLVEYVQMQIEESDEEQGRNWSGQREEADGEYTATPVNVEGTVSMNEPDEGGWDDQAETASQENSTPSDDQSDASTPVRHVLRAALRELSSTADSNVNIDALRTVFLRSSDMLQNDDRPGHTSNGESNAWVDESVQTSANQTPSSFEDVEMIEQVMSDQEEQSGGEESSLTEDCVIPSIVRSTSSNSNLSLLNLDVKDRAEKEAKREKRTSIDEYVMLTTGKDVMLHNVSIPRMKRIRAEHAIISRIDIRTEEMLNLLDRINMVEWLPELELFIVASQKGTVALMRILQVEFENGSQGCMFNNEYYLPHHVLQSSPLYGMTVRKVKSERFAPIAYEVFLFYHSGNVLGYTLTRKESDVFMTENLFF